MPTLLAGTAGAHALQQLRPGASQVRAAAAIAAGLLLVPVVRANLGGRSQQQADPPSIACC